MGIGFDKLIISLNECYALMTNIYFSENIGTICFLNIASLSCCRLIDYTICYTQIEIIIYMENYKEE